MKKLPDSELDIMLIIWEFNRPVTRFEIEGEMNGNKNLSATTILSFLSRLQENGFLEVTKEGKNNIYTAVIDKESYMRMDSENVLKKLYRNSIKNFVASLYDGDNLSETDIKELEEYLHQKRGK